MNSSPLTEETSNRKIAPKITENIAWDYLEDYQKAQIAKLRPDIYQAIQEQIKGG